jgi:CRP-like cAMP-binding protein
MRTLIKLVCCLTNVGLARKMLKIEEPLKGSLLHECNHSLSLGNVASSTQVLPRHSSALAKLLFASRPHAPFARAFNPSVQQRRMCPPRAEKKQGPVSTTISRVLYETLAPLDRGDFRWEFLVPWTNKTLTSVDKFIVCSTFIGISISLQKVFDPGASIGVHLSYITQFFSYAAGNPIFLRILAVVTSLLEIFGSVYEPQNQGMFVQQPKWDFIEAFRANTEMDLFPVVYDELFVIINAYYILRWIVSRESIAAASEWSEEEEELYTECFAELGFRRAQFSRLLRSAKFVRVGETGDTLTVQGQPIYDIFVPLKGEVEVRVDGVVATTLPSCQLVGEASLLENLQSPGGEFHPASRATVVAAPGAKYVTWPQSAFYELQQEEDSEFAYAIQLMIARQLSTKLKEARLSQRQLETSTVTPAAQGADAEVKALLACTERFERRIKTLEGTLEDRDQELFSIKSIAVSGAVIGYLGLANMLENLDLAWLFENLFGKMQVEAV